MLKSGEIEAGITNFKLEHMDSVRARGGGGEERYTFWVSRRTLLRMQSEQQRLEQRAQADGERERRKRAKTLLQSRQHLVDCFMGEEIHPLSRLHVTTDTNARVNAIRREIRHTSGECSSRCDDLRPIRLTWIEPLG